MTQKQLVVRQLTERGEISRNQALGNHITRLSAIIFELEKEGWQIEGKWQITERGKDYVYMKRNRRFTSAEEANEFIRSLA